MGIRDDLTKLNAPRKVLDAGEEIDKCVQAGVLYPFSLVCYVRQWVNKQQGQNRYGK